MRKSFLVKAFFLVVLLASVLAIIIVTMNRNISGSFDEKGGTQTFFDQFIIAGGPIVWFVLLPMSLVTVFLAVEHNLLICRKRLLPVQISEEIIETVRQFNPGQWINQTAKSEDLVSVAFGKAVTEGGGDWFRMRSAFAESLQEQALKYLRRIEWISLIGNVSPMIGLFGTVFGMIKLFNAIVIAGGQPQPSQLAGGISVALVTTFWGLFIAIPALAIHSVLRNRIETLVSDAVGQSDKIISEIRRCLKKQMQSEFVSSEKPKQPIVEIIEKKAQAVRRTQKLT